MTRNDEIKWPKENCSDVVQHIKTSVLHLRKKSSVNQLTKLLERPGCQYQTPEQQQQLNTEVSTEPPNLSKWPRLARQHNRMYEEFLYLKEKYSHMLSEGFMLYSKLYIERGGRKFYSLMWHFLYCMTFLRHSRNDLLLISREEFDYYARNIQVMVTGDDSMENLHNNINIKTADRKQGLPKNDFSTESALSAQFERDSSDWQKDLLKKIELMRKTEWGRITLFYGEVRKMCLQSPEAAAELYLDKRYLGFALKFLALRKDAKIEKPKEECDAAVHTVKLYAMRYRNEYLIECIWVPEGTEGCQSCLPHQQLQTEVQDDYLDPTASGVYNALMVDPKESTLTTEHAELADWQEHLFGEIEFMRKEYLPVIREAYRRACIMLYEDVGSAPEIEADKTFLAVALKFLALTRKDIVQVKKDKCFEFLEKIEAYVLDYKNKPLEQQLRVLDPRCQKLLKWKFSIE